MNMTVSIASDFSRTPGGRYKKDGSYSGEQFRTEVMLPQFETALRTGSRLYINLDGTAGYATSFLEEAFGGLVRCLNRRLSDVVVIQTENQVRLQEVEGYISEAESRLR